MTVTFNGEAWKHCFYVGEFAELLGQRTLVKPDGTAQFDCHALLHPRTGAKLAFGWHQFSLEDFEEMVYG